MIEAAPRFVDGNKQIPPKHPVRLEIPVADERPQEECGLLSFYAPNGMTGVEAARIFAAAEGVQHRGQQGGGVIAHGIEGEKFVHKGFGLLTDALPKDVQDQVTNMGPLRSVTIQARYGTHGGYEQDNLHPLEATTKKGVVIDLSHNGDFADTKASRAKSEKVYSYDVSDSRVKVDALAATEEDINDDYIVNEVQLAVGAASMIINVNGETQYAARDVKGIRPLVIGTIEGELGPIHIVASETRALQLIGAPVERDIRPGEVVKLDSDGVTVLYKGDKTAERMCSMEHAYMSHPESRVNVTSNGASPETWPRNEDNRREIGRQLGREEKARQITARQRAERRGEQFKEFKPDVVIGIPSSGIPFGEGYAEAMEVPYKQLITKNPEVKQRMFQADDMKDKRREEILNKLQVQFPEDWVWNGKVIVLTDDSQVRGDASIVLTKVLKELGAEVHWRIGFPKIVNPCHLGVSIRTHDELIAYRNQGDAQKIAAETGAASVENISNIGFVRSIQGDHFEETSDPTDVFDKNRMCGGCVTGEYPYQREEDVPITLLAS